MNKDTGSSNTTLNVKDGTTVISDSAIINKSEITKIIMPPTLKKIGNIAICGCSNLISVELNEGLEDIGNNAFSACSSLTSITLPSTLKYIRYRAFYNCRNIEFGNLVITEGVKTIGSYSFYYCLGIKSLKTPTTLFMIAQNAFNNCYNLENVELGEGLRIITDGAFIGCSGFVPEAYENQRVTLNSKDASKQVSGFEVNEEIKIGNYFYMPAENVKITNITYDNQLLHQELSVWMVMHLQYYWKAIKVKNHKKT